MGSPWSIAFEKMSGAGMNRYHNNELMDALAAEYVIGTLHCRARRRFIRLMQSNSELREQVENWESRLNKLADQARPVPAPEAIWRNIDQRLFNENRVAGTSSDPVWAWSGNLYSLRMRISTCITRMAATPARREPTWPPACSMGS